MAEFNNLILLTILFSLLLLFVSQHALAVLVEANEGAESVLLPCQYSGFIPEDPTVMWTRSDLDPKSVHLLREGGDDLRGQNQRYSGRTSVRSDALDSGDFSLTLRNPQLTDSGSYTCSISDGRKELKLGDIQLQVKDQQVEVKVEEGSESVILPCRTTPDLPEDTRVDWTRSDPDLVYIIQMKMNEDLLRTGDRSLTLKQPTQRDCGEYICTIYRDKDILKQKVVLQVKEPFLSWATAFLVLLVLVLVVSGGLLFCFWHNFMSLFQVKVEVKEGAESVQLPFKTTRNLPADAKVMWERYDERKMVYVFCKKTDETEQHEDYRDRTEMNEDPPRDLTLTLKQPKEADSGEYRCLVWRRGDFIRKKSVLLTVRGLSQVEEGGEEAQVDPLQMRSVH
ncbi:butyrophilin subfamily 3 member A2-like [Archocentrus centrarchus]|uniref:butyrophilin subfamily 3 member A2-like n=1 Tax=Archocentrus centrarchus TaxID=63155 RepID=UPI0011E9F45D|nr:butyrophilin subfamily 3 member A2-like [Archocentrus centrarchus]